MIKRQVRKVAGRYVQSVLFDHFYRKTLKKVVRMMLFEVIQESVDLVYFLEEDTISMANSLLDKVILRETKCIVRQVITEIKGTKAIEPEEEPSKAVLTVVESRLNEDSECFMPFEDDESLQII